MQGFPSAEPQGWVARASDWVKRKSEAGKCQILAAEDNTGELSNEAQTDWRPRSGATA